jgi:hypothetical protein
LCYDFLIVDVIFEKIYKIFWQNQKLKQISEAIIGLSERFLKKWNRHDKGV